MLGFNFGLIRRLWMNAIFLGIFVSSGYGQTITIPAWDCAGKDKTVWRQEPGKHEAAESYCTCPCKGAKYMGLQGDETNPKNGITKAYPKSGNIWYKFSGKSGTYTMTHYYRADNDGNAPYTVYVDNKKVATGVNTTGNKDKTNVHKDIKLKSGSTIKLHLTAKYKGDHGNYNRFKKMEFKKTAEEKSTSIVPIRAFETQSNFILILPEIQSKNQPSLDIIGREIFQ